MSATRALPLIAGLGLCLLLWVQAFIDLEWAVDLGPWHMNAPLADLLAAGLIPIGLTLWRGTPTPLPGWRGYALFLLACLGSLATANDLGTAAHHLIRKPLFLYVAYAVALPVIVRRAPDRLVAAGLLGGVLATCAVSLITSVGRIAAGEALWFQTIEGLTPNHKTLAVALAAQIPLLLALPTLLPALPPRLTRLRWPALALLLLTLAGSASKTAWITAFFALAWFVPRGRPLATRPRLLAPLVVVSLALALYAPLLIGSKAMLDAARSRHSLNVRAWEMFARHPLLGSGTGMNVVEEMVTFPHYRVNGVDAHGVIQKVASETGLAGLAGYLAFVVATGLPLLRRARQEGSAGPAWALLATFGALHLNLLLSTETLSPTHWAPFALMWGLFWRTAPATADPEPWP